MRETFQHLLVLGIENCEFTAFLPTELSITVEVGTQIYGPYQLRFMPLLCQSCTCTTSMQHLRHSYAKTTLIYHSQAVFQCLWHICASGVPHGQVYQSFGGVAGLLGTGWVHILVWSSCSLTFLVDQSPISVTSISHFFG